MWFRAASNILGRLRIVISISFAANSGLLDVGSGYADIKSGSLSNLTQQLQQGFAGGTWNGLQGITSSSAFSDTAHVTASGLIQNNQSGTALFTASSKFDGTVPGAGDLLVKYTYYGDANLDGKVDASDYSLIDSGFTTHATGWFNGDFNYDGTINGSDYTLIDNAFNIQGAQLSMQMVDPASVVTDEIASVPEPTLLMAEMLLIGFLGRRSKRVKLLNTRHQLNQHAMVNSFRLTTV